ncbi:MAG: sulfatase [Pirellulales bacterium]|nr:sulfatase [Pirellulales bacterium]
MQHIGCIIVAGIILLASDALRAADRPNIVVFISDDHSFADCSAGGATDVATPHLARMLSEGISFTRAFAASPSCAPSRAALLTGLSPLRNGSMFNHQPPRTDVKKLPAYLHQQGYEVVAFGKVAHYRQGKDYGFDLVAHDTFHDDRCVDAAIDWLEQRRSDRPLCIMVGTNWPHVPWPEPRDSHAAAALKLPPTHVDTAETRAYRARYYAAIELMDDDLGRVYESAYRVLGRETLFLHFSDHGAQWPFGKWNLYDAGLHVPLLAVWPGVIEPGSRNDELVTLLDVLPTLVQVAGGEPPAELDGRSLAPAFSGRSLPRREFVFATHSGDGRMNQYPMRSVRTGSWKYIRNLNPAAVFTSHITAGAAVDGRSYWQSWVEQAKHDPAAAAIVERHRHRPAEELYDLSADPYEQQNLAQDAQQAATLQRLRARLDGWMAGQGDQGLQTEHQVANEFLDASQ